MNLQRDRSEPTAEEEELVERRAHEHEVESVSGWHYVTIMRRCMPQESHIQWASRVLGREVKFMDELQPADLAALKKDLRDAEKGEE